MLAAVLLATAATRVIPRARALDLGRAPQSFALWVTTKANPDEAMCSGRLVLSSSHTTATGETRVYSTTDGRYSAIVTISSAGRVTVALKLLDVAGVGRGMVALAEDADAQALSKGFLAGDVTMFDQAVREPKAIGNVTLLPIAALS